MFAPQAHLYRQAAGSSIALPYRIQVLWRRRQPRQRHSCAFIPATCPKFDELAARNTALSRTPWSSAVDHLVFTEGRLLEEESLRLWRESGLPNVHFIDVSADFGPVGPLASSSNLCHETSVSCIHCGQGHGCDGYKRMCWFWYAGIYPYVTSRQFLLRLDDDVTLTSPESTVWPSGVAQPCAAPSISSEMCNQVVQVAKAGGLPTAGRAPVSSPYFQGEDNPEVTVGMTQLFRNVATKLGGEWPQKPWISPYTNLMLYDLAWNASSSRELRLAFDKVHGSNCISINRWGDLPLWGATLKLLGAPPFTFRMPYKHGAKDAYQMLKTAPLMPVS